MKEHKLNCNCGMIEHSWFFKADVCDPGELYMTTFLSTRPFFTRLKNAIKYLFGYKCIYGHFDETIINVNEAKKLVEFFNEFISDSENNVKTKSLAEVFNKLVYNGEERNNEKI